MKTKFFFSILLANTLFLSACSAGTTEQVIPANNTISENSSDTSNDISELSTDIQETEDWSFQYNKELGGIIIRKCLCVSKTTDERIYSADKDIVVPDEFAGYEGIKVLEIGSGAFSNAICKSLTFPDGLLYIDKNAFNSAEISSALSIPKTVVNIDEYAFSHLTCPAVELPPITEISQNMFEWAKVDNITIPDTVKSIGFNAFHNATVNEIYLPDGLEHIEIGALEYLSCPLLRIPESVLPAERGTFPPVWTNTIAEIGEDTYDLTDFEQASAFNIRVYGIDTSTRVTNTYNHYTLTQSRLQFVIGFLYLCYM